MSRPRRAFPPGSSAADQASPSAAGPHSPDDKLDELALRKIARLIQSGKAKHIAILTGAGISTSAGIPDFRSPETGLYANLEALQLPDPQAVFDIDYFRRRPEISEHARTMPGQCQENARRGDVEVMAAARSDGTEGPFWTLAKDLYPGKYFPTPTHHFLALLASPAHRRLLRLFSQNIDTLESIAGVPADRIVEAHGSFGAAHCIDCGREYGRGYVIQAGVRDGRVVRCKGGDVDVDGSASGSSPGSGSEQKSGLASESSTSTTSRAAQGKGKVDKSKRKQVAETDSKGCGGLVKPDIVFFGEGLPDRFFERMSDMRKADLVIIIGTSLQVGPFNQLPRLAPPDCPRILINREAVAEFDMVERRQARYIQQRRRQIEAAARADAKQAAAAAAAAATDKNGKGKVEQGRHEAVKGEEELVGGLAKLGIEGGHAGASIPAQESAAGEAQKLAHDVKRAVDGDGRTDAATTTAPSSSAPPNTDSRNPSTNRSSISQDDTQAEPTRKDNDEPEPEAVAEAGAAPERREADWEQELDEGYDDRDAFYKGDADTAVLRLAEMLGWKDELTERIAELNGRLKREWGMA